MHVAGGEEGSFCWSLLVVDTSNTENAVAVEFSESLLIFFGNGRPDSLRGILSNGITGRPDSLRGILLGGVFFWIGRPDSLRGILIIIFGRPDSLRGILHINMGLVVIFSAASASAFAFLFFTANSDIHAGFPPL